MTSFFTSIIGIIVTIFLVVSIHEYGHFLFARLLGVKVLRFSIGFGKPFYCWHNKKGTEFALAPIPLGGYVKLLDENEGAVPENERRFAYNRQPLYKQFLIVAAGPLFNLVLAFILYWLLFVIGFTTVIPLVGKITPHSIADTAGMKPQQEVISVNHTPVSTWMSVIINILGQTGNTGTMPVEVKKLTSQQPKLLLFNLADWHLDELKPEPLESLGIKPYEPPIPAIINIIQPDSNAISKLQKDDKILFIDNKSIHDWYDVADIISKHPDQALSFIIQRQQKKISFNLMIGHQRDMLLHKHGYLGISPAFTFPNALLRNQQYGPIDALTHAWHETYDLVQLNFILLEKMFTGKLSLKSLGGPITIFESAGTALNAGMIPFLSFLAFLSIAIGIINILPIPGLDGGHILFQLIALIIRRPLPLKIQLLMYRMGLILLLLLVTQALVNDFLRM